MSGTVLGTVLQGRDVSMLIGIPRTDEQWQKASRIQASVAWNFDDSAHYHDQLRINDCERALDRISREWGMTLRWPFRLAEVEEAVSGRSLVIFLSHLHKQFFIETGDGFVHVDKLWGSFPPGWRGEVDLTGCSSKDVRRSYQAAFGRRSLPALLTEDIRLSGWLSFYARAYLDILSKSPLSFGQTLIVIGMRVHDAIETDIRRPPDVEERS